MMIVNDVNGFDEKTQAEVTLEELGFVYNAEDSVFNKGCIKAYRQDYKDDKGLKYSIVAQIKYYENTDKPFDVEFTAELCQPETNNKFELTFANYNYQDMLNILDGFLADGFAVAYEANKEVE